MDADQLIELILENAKKDRKKLETVCDALLKIGSVGEFQDPEAQASVAIPMAKVAEALTKNNAQLVELVKIKVRSVPKKEEEFSDDDLAEAYEQLNSTNFEGKN